MQIGMTGSTCDLLKLFIEPDEIGKGYGTHLYAWAISEGRRLGASMMRIEADPDAEAFYRRMGARTVGVVASLSIPGRKLPLFQHSLVDAATTL